MGRKADPSRAHFKKVCVAVEGAAKQKISWDCNHCGFKMKYTRFPAAQGRIHLAADRGLIKSLWNKPCTADDEDAATRQASKVSTARERSKVRFEQKAARAPGAADDPRHRLGEGSRPGAGRRPDQ